ncbi:unnamed protein product [Pleuronectes platessa]|uniref:Uncharacterized protein n=1 Tax=Pleuronectes platessa TaxID=8262 RepID=A0A9N7TU63_PLEPL|nr:unnamed protein product [Pleuronectes platessa]
MGGRGRGGGGPPGGTGCSGWEDRKKSVHVKPSCRLASRDASTPEAAELDPKTSSRLIHPTTSPVHEIRPSPRLTTSQLVSEKKSQGRHLFTEENEDRGGLGAVSRSEHWDWELQVDGGQRLMVSTTASPRQRTSDSNILYENVSEPEGRLVNKLVPAAVQTARGGQPAALQRRVNGSRLPAPPPAGVELHRRRVHSEEEAGLQKQQRQGSEGQQGETQWETPSGRHPVGDSGTPSGRHPVGDTQWETRGLVQQWGCAPAQPVPQRMKLERGGVMMMVKQETDTKTGKKYLLMRREGPYH